MYKSKMITLALVATTILLVGCGATTSEIVVRSKFIEPPTVLLKDCLIPVPPNKDLYLMASLQEREGLLYEYAMTQTLELSKCNADKQSLKKWVEEQKAIFNGANNAKQ